MSEPMVEQSPAEQQAQRDRLNRETRQRLAARRSSPGGGRIPLGQPAQRVSARTPRGFTPQQAAAGYAAGKARQAARTAGQARVVPGNRQYQPVILAEFLIAVILIAVAPVATGGSPTAKAKSSPSPYDTGDLKQLVATGGVFFILALVSSGRHGRLAAWLGGLIVVAIGLSKAGQANLAAVFTAVSGTASEEVSRTQTV